MIRATSATLKRLFVGEVPSNMGKAVVEAIKPVLPQLTSFTIFDGPTLPSEGHKSNALFLETA